MDLPKRKRNRLKNYDYSSPGAYFITICTENRRKILSEVVGTGVLDGPQTILSDYGKIADKYINEMNDFYDDISVEQYVIMPNHIHLLILISSDTNANGPSGTPVPTTRQNSKIARFVSTFKRFCNKEYGKNVWQARSHDHVVRDKRDYERISKYIHENPLVWQYDCFYNAGAQ